MGMCHSSAKARRKNGWRDGTGNLDSKLKSVSSGDFGSYMTKFGGVGGGRGRAASPAAVGLDERGLFHAPGRLFSNRACRFASLYTQEGKKGTNQDAMIFWENFLVGNSDSATFCGVFDGHGPYGHVVARKVRDALPVLLRAHWGNKTGNGQTNSVDGRRGFDDSVEEDGCDSFEGDEVEKVPDKHIPTKNSILKAFNLMDKELKFHPTIDCFCSGTTAVTLIKQGADLILGNVGDSRAILATRDTQNALVAVQLTVDLKPNLPREAARIQKCNGRVFALQDEPEVVRVWLPNSDSPGLAMARAFGDFCLKDFGLISRPDVYYHHVSEQDEFVILATDGVWDVLSNKEAVDIVASAPSRGTSARALVDCATRAWRLKYPTSKIDDCAVICLFLDHQPPPRGSVQLGSKPPDAVNTAMALITPEAPATTESIEIVPVMQERDPKRITRSNVGQSNRSLAECLLNTEEEWSALEGVTRVNSLLSLPRLLPSDKSRRNRA